MFEIVKIAPDGTIVLPSEIRDRFKMARRVLVMEGGKDTLILKKIEPSRFAPSVDEERLNRLAPLTEKEIEDEVHVYRNQQRGKG